MRRRAYGNQQFNQGAAEARRLEAQVRRADLKGPYDAKTGKYTLEWSSAIVGGPFDGFTGVWHLEGAFKKQ